MNSQLGDFVVHGESRTIDAWAYQHLVAAATMRDHVVALEGSNTEVGPFFTDVRSYCSCCITSAAASLEALINEHFLDDGGQLRRLLPDFDNQFWGPKGIERRMGILAKYQHALDLLGVPKLDEDSVAFKDAAGLIELRNALVHFKPPWDLTRSRPLALEVALAGKYPLSPFVSGHADFAGMHSMSAGCSAWAVNSVKRFVREFDSHAALNDVKVALLLGIR